LMIIPRWLFPFGDLRFLGDWLDAIWRHICCEARRRWNYFMLSSPTTSFKSPHFVHL
jgi:hypothetical protein